MSGPLEGIRVIDCGIWLQGPLAATLLGDMGAEIVKIERRIHGDPLRGAALGLGDLKNERNPMFEAANRNKRGITVDLTKQAGTDIVHKLAHHSDVFVHNLRSDAAKTLRLDYQTLSAINSRLIYAQASAWGLKGPESKRAGYEGTVGARAGFMYLVGEPDDPAPKKYPDGICDGAGALVLALGILAALQARERNGKGQMVDTSGFGAAITLATWPVMYALAYGTDPFRRSRTTQNPLATSYRCADGEWIKLSMHQGNRYWGAFCKVMGIKELEEDPGFDDIAVRVKNAPELVAILDKMFSTKPRGEWMKLFAENDLVFAPIQRLRDLATDPQALANEYIIEYNHPAYGRENMVGFPYKFSETPASIGRPGPELGQHTEEVLLEIGYTWDDIASLKQEEVI